MPRYATMSRMSTRRSRRVPASKTPRRPRRQAGMAGLRRQVRSLARKVNITSHRVQFTDSIVDYPTSSVLGPFVGTFNLSNYAQWSYQFPTSAVGFPINYQATHLKSRVDIILKKKYTGLGKEVDNVTFTIFLARLRDSRGVLNSTNPMQLGNDYTIQDGLAFLNPKNFQLLARRVVVLASDDSGPNEKRLTLHAKMNAKIVNTGNLSTGAQSWKNLNESPDPSDNLFLFVFSNDLQGDLQSTAMSYHAIHSVLT